MKLCKQRRRNPVDVTSALKNLKYATGKKYVFSTQATPPRSQKTSKNQWFFTDAPNQTGNARMPSPTASQIQAAIPTSSYGAAPLRRPKPHSRVASGFLPLGKSQFWGIIIKKCSWSHSGPEGDGDDGITPGWTKDARGCSSSLFPQGERKRNPGYNEWMRWTSRATRPPRFVLQDPASPRDCRAVKRLF